MAHDRTGWATNDSWSLLPAKERQRRAKRLRDKLRSIPRYKHAEEMGGNEFWARFYDSRVNL